MGVVWGDGLAPHECPSQGVGICSCLLYFLRGLGDRVHAWLMRV
jgi:hypothetical protein